MEDYWSQDYPLFLLFSMNSGVRGYSLHDSDRSLKSAVQSCILEYLKVLLHLEIKHLFEHFVNALIELEEGWTVT